MTRGEVWWAELAGDAGFRPVVIVSRSDSISRRLNVTIAEVTRTARSLPSEVPSTKSQEMPVDCVANTNNLHTIPKDRLKEKIVTMTREQEFALTNALRYSLDVEW